MAFSKVLQLGSAGSLSLNEGAGVVSVKVSVGGSLGGGEAAGVAKAMASAEVDVADAQMAELVLDYLKAKVPAGAALISDLEAVLLPALQNN